MVNSYSVGGIGITKRIPNPEAVSAVSYQTTTTYSITSVDIGVTLVYNGGPINPAGWTILGGVALGAEFNVYVENRGVNRRPLVITPATGTINGKAKLTIPFGAGASISSDGTGDLIASYSFGLGGIIPFSRSSTPMILQSSGTVGANGALSNITALPETYSGGAYLHFPAGRLFAGSTAGLYWTVMTSTTAGTVFNNRYISGEPLPPPSLTPIVSSSMGAYTQVTGVDR